MLHAVADMPLNVLVILAHPRHPSLCGALADAYAEGARAAGMAVRFIALSALEFDPDVRESSPLQQPLEPDLANAWKDIAWADHLLFVFPAWWGVGPAKMHGFLDRILLPGVAFREQDGRYEGLLHGKTAHLITTMDMPPWVYRLIFREPGHTAMRRSILGFCGIATTRTLPLGPVRESTADQRQAWIGQARDLGLSLRHGPRSRPARIAHQLLTWTKALRLQFYPMSWMAYTVGALGADGPVAPGRYWLGYAFLFFAEAATVFANERFDFDTDRRNRHHGPFNGGSRVLVNGDLSFQQMGRGIAVTLALAAGCAGLLLAASASGAAFAALMLLLVLAMGYTVPPLRLSWRGLGEIDVGLTHSAGVILCGYLLQGGAWQDGFPWLVSLPLFLSILPSIIVAGYPDLEADRLAGKHTLATRLGHRRTLLLAMVPTLAAPAAALAVRDMPALRGCLDGVLTGAVPHGLLLLWLLWRERSRPGGRVDLLLVVALTYLLWFVVVPLLRLA